MDAIPEQTGPLVDVKIRRGPGVEVTYDPGNDSVVLALSGLAARRLMLALGVNTKRYGPEISALLTGLTKLLVGVPSGATEQANPHGRDCTCGHCEEAFG